MSPTPLEEPPFVRNITALQKVVAAIAISTLGVIWVGGWDVVQSFFDKSGLLAAWTIFRGILGFCCAGEISFIGYHQIGNMMNWLIDGYQKWKKMKEFNSKDE